MKRIIWINGLIAGGIVLAVFFISYPFMENGTLTFDNSMYVGYATMVIALSVIFFAIKNYRDNHLGGTIKFGTAVKIGVLITLIASAIYSIGWEVYYNVWASDFYEKYQAYELDKMRSSGATEAEINATKAEVEKFSEMFKNPVFRFLFTGLMEFFPVGLVISLISAGLLRKRQILPA